MLFYYWYYCSAEKKKSIKLSGYWSGQLRFGGVVNQFKLLWCWWTEQQVQVFVLSHSHPKTVLSEFKHGRTPSLRELHSLETQPQNLRERRLCVVKRTHQLFANSATAEFQTSSGIKISTKTLHRKLRSISFHGPATPSNVLQQEKVFHFCIILS